MQQTCLGAVERLSNDEHTTIKLSAEICSFLLSRAVILLTLRSLFGAADEHYPQDLPFLAQRTHACLGGGSDLCNLVTKLLLLSSM